MTASLERRKETLRLAHEHNFIILEGIFLALSPEDICSIRPFEQMIHTFTCTMVKPAGTLRTLHSNSSNQSSGECSDLIVFPKFCRLACASGLFVVQNRYSTPSTFTYVYFLVTFSFIYGMNDGYLRRARLYTPNHLP